MTITFERPQERERSQLPKGSSGRPALRPAPMEKNRGTDVRYSFHLAALNANRGTDVRYNPHPAEYDHFSTQIKHPASSKLQRTIRRSD